jgi:hypothetical protein
MFSRFLPVLSRKTFHLRLENFKRICKEETDEHQGSQSSFLEVDSRSHHDPGTTIQRKTKNSRADGWKANAVETIVLSHSQAAERCIPQLVILIPFNPAGPTA